jgi:poly-beta-hydroxybutyrate-responsive repressor
MGESPEQEESENPKPKLPKVEAPPRNWLEPVALVTLREWNSYGYELMARLTEFGFEAMNPGTLYRTLRRMESNGLCESKWETSEGGPARRRYFITEAEEMYLGLWAEALEQYQRTMNAFFRLYTGRRP